MDDHYSAVHHCSRCKRVFTPPTNKEWTVYTFALVWGLTSAVTYPCKSLINKGITALVVV
jgi:hypothetical protein